MTEETTSLGEKRTVQIARVAYEANRTYCRTLDEYTKAPWQYTETWRREAMLSCVRYCLINADATPKEVHENWLAFMYAAAWSYGEDLSEPAKTHPSFLPYEQLPTKRRRTYALIVAIVAAFTAG